MSTESKNIVKSDGDIDVGCGNAFGSGGEEEGGGADNTVATVNNVIDGFQYTETQIGTAADFKTWIKEYVGLIVKARKDKAAESMQLRFYLPRILTYFLLNHRGPTSSY